MSEGKTPGRLAYEELSRRVGSEYDSWDKLPGDLRAAHEASVAAASAAAHERTAELVSEVNELRKQLDAARKFTPLDLADQAIGLFLEYRDTHGYDETSARSAAALEVAQGAAVTDAELAGDAEAAVVTSGTEHLAELIGSLAIGGEEA